MVASAAAGLMRSAPLAVPREQTMPAERVPMRDAREIIRLKFSAGLATREIARRLGVAPSTVRETLKRLSMSGLSWPVAEGLSEAELEAALYAGRGSKRGHRLRAEPDWPAIHRELKRKHVTLQIVWDEYIAAHPGGYSYSRFCELNRAFEKTLSPTMRQTHAAGERLFVDYAGDGVPVVIDRLTGEVRMAQIFVAVLGASSFTFAHASWTQTLPDWIDAHVRALTAIGGVPQLIVPDNTKTAVIKACLYDPQVNRTYSEMAAHYGSAILPARPRKPRDKSKVEQAVLIVERWLIGRLRHRTFHSLAEVNASIGDLMTGLNEVRPIRRLGVTRRRLLEEVDRPAEAVADGALRVRGMEEVPRRRRLSCRCRLPLLQRPASFPARRSRGAPDDADRRGFLQGRTDRRSSPRRRQSQAHDALRAYAVQPPTLRRLDDRAHPRRRAADRAGDGGAVRADPGIPPPSRAGLPGMPRDRQAVGALRRPATRGGDRARPRDRRQDLRLRQIHPRQPSRSAPRRNTAHGRDADRASQHPWAALLQLGETPCSSILPSTNSTRSVSKEWPRPSRTSPQAGKPIVSALSIGSDFSSIERSRGGRTSGSQHGCGSPGCASRPASRMSTIGPPATSIAPCSRSWSREAGSTLTTIWRSSVRPAWARVGWRPPSATRPAATIGRFSTSVSRGYLRSWRSRAATAVMPVSCAVSAAPIS